MSNINNELIELIKEQIGQDIELYTKAHLLWQQGLSLNEFDKLSTKDKNFHIASMIYCKEEETKNQIALAKISNPYIKEKLDKKRIVKERKRNAELFKKLIDGIHDRPQLLDSDDVIEIGSVFKERINILDWILSDIDSLEEFEKKNSDNLLKEFLNK